MVATHLYIVGNIESENPILNILDTKNIAREVASGKLKLVVKKNIKGRELNKLKNRTPINNLILTST
jgi:predicted Ser/Thr protein kinase